MKKGINMNVKTKPKMNTVQHQGYDDFELGRLSDENPYVRTSDNFRFWNQGYQLAKVASWEDE